MAMRPLNTCRKLEIVFDFDGVICRQIKPYNHFRYGKPNTEVIRLIKLLFHEGHKLKLSTARLCPTFNGKKDRDVIRGRVKYFLVKHLEKLGIRHCFTEVTGYKPFGHVYIDDRGLYYDGENHAHIIETIRKIANDDKV